MSIGILRAGPLGGIIAWLGFTLPSAAALTAIALVLSDADAHTLDLLHGLKVVAVAVVAQAVWGMARNLAPDRVRATVAVIAAGAVLTLPTSISQISVIAVAAVFGWRFLRPEETAAPPPHMKPPVPRWMGVLCWVLLFVLLAGLPLLRSQSSSHSVALVDSFYRSGLLVFGGGHVVLPLLQAQVVPDWIGNGEFLAGYGFAQAVPGPLFTFAAYLGAAMGPAPNGVAGAAIALLVQF
jgi:chromate transporter